MIIIHMSDYLLVITNKISTGNIPFEYSRNHSIIILTYFIRSIHLYDVIILNARLKLFGQAVSTFYAQCVYP